jgi:hypothetical protein
MMNHPSWFHQKHVLARPQIGPSSIPERFLGTAIFTGVDETTVMSKLVILLGQLIRNPEFPLT